MSKSPFNQEANQQKYHDLKGLLGFVQISVVNNSLTITRESIARVAIIAGTGEATVGIGTSGISVTW